MNKLTAVQPLVAPHGVIRKEKKPYDEGESLVSLESIATYLGLNIKRHDFDEKEYVKITYIALEELYTDKIYQRLIDKEFISGANCFEPTLVRPVIVFKRPGVSYYIVSDGQHIVVIGILYTTKGPKTKVPCQVHVHPSHYTTEQCVAAEAKFFRDINKRRRNVSALARLRAEISYGDPLALIKEDKLMDLKVHLEKIGDTEGPEVHGLSKLLSAYDEYGVHNTINAIELYQKLRNNSTFDKWNEDKNLRGAIIGGFAAIYQLKEKALGKGDKNHALEVYLKDFLGFDSPKVLSNLTAGNTQAILIARRIIESCNLMIRTQVIRKRNGEVLGHLIEEDVMTKAGLGDPSKSA